MVYKTILVTREDGYAVVTLNRPKEMNALSVEMRFELEECFRVLEIDESVKAVILTGGDYVFSAGMDIKEMAALPDGEIDDYFATMISYLQKIYSFKKPVIAAVGGIALGGGFNLATVCDMIIASETAIFGHPELKFGLNPLLDPLRRIVGLAKAKEIAMLGEPIGAQEALRIGLANKVVSPDYYMEEAKAIARELAKRSAKALEAVKRLSDIVPRLDRNSALEHEFEITALLFSRSERKEHMKTFLEALKKRKK
ncbi:MAG: enoyl-CoA hydratase/isomerase family protein [Deltaproteobacteria bacterium]|nr:enoyl-CoA hydratase/isomerase family protein [Deltaproteobacteria bacterium]MBN2687547.1 enoyl-CoA hydratase/isomerase family protein [Deltaproteobacteria bacterium]